MGESLTLHVTVVVLALLLGILAVSETARGALLLAKEMWEQVEFLLLPVGGSPLQSLAATKEATRRCSRIAGRIIPRSMQRLAREL